MSGPERDAQGRISYYGDIVGQVKAWEPITAADIQSFSKGWPPLTEGQQIRARLNKRLRGNKWPNNTKGTP